MAFLLTGCIAGLSPSSVADTVPSGPERKPVSAMVLERSLTQALGPNGIEIRQVAQGNQVLVVLKGVRGYPVGQTALTPVMMSSLDKIAATLAQVAYSQILITGHTDNLGSHAYNNELSLDRARVMRDYLAERGVLRSHMLALGHGKQFPVADNGTEAGRAANRRMEISIQLAPR